MRDGGDLHHRVEVPDEREPNTIADGGAVGFDLGAPPSGQLGSLGERLLDPYSAPFC